MGQSLSFGLGGFRFMGLRPSISDAASFTRSESQSCMRTPSMAQAARMSRKTSASILVPVYSHQRCLFSGIAATIWDTWFLLLLILSAQTVLLKILSNLNILVKPVNLDNWLTDG